MENAHEFIRAVREQDAEAAARLCSEDVEIMLPGANVPIRGRDGVREMIRMAPVLEHGIRGSEERAGEVRVTTLTRAPGVFANYTTWIFEEHADKIRRLSFELKGAN